MFRNQPDLIQTLDEGAEGLFLWDSTIPKDPAYPIFLLRDFLELERAGAKSTNG